MLPRALLISLLAAVPLHAGLNAGFVMEFEARNTSTASYAFSGKAFVDGKGNVRYEIVEGNHPVFTSKITIVSRDEGQTLFVIDHKQRTYFIRKTKTMSGPLSTWKAPGQVSASRPTLDVRRDDGPPETVAGRPTRKVTVKASYTIDLTLEGEKLKAKVDVEGTFWMLETRTKADPMPYAFEFALKSGDPSLDDKISRHFGGRGIPLRESVTVTRSISDGAPVSETFAIGVTSVKDEELDPQMFGPPPGYQFREPTFGYQ